MYSSPSFSLLCSVCTNQLFFFLLLSERVPCQVDSAFSVVTHLCPAVLWVESLPFHLHRYSFVHRSSSRTDVMRRTGHSKHVSMVFFVWVHVVSFWLYSFSGAIGEHLLWVFVPSVAQHLLHSQTVTSTAPVPVQETLEEHAYDTPTKALANPVITGFPIYGLGCFLLLLQRQLLVQAFRGKIHWTVWTLLEFLSSAVLLASWEYAVGVYVGAGPDSYDQDGNVISWDYSDRFCNLHGKTDLQHAILFGVAEVVLFRLHPRVKRAAAGALVALLFWDDYESHLCDGLLRKQE